MMFVKAFIVGGFICVIGQLLLAKTKLTFASVILSAVGLYQPLVDFAGAGATVPLTGFGHSLATGTQKMILEKGFTGILAGGITATAGGIGAAIFFGYLNALIFNPKTKK